MEFWPANRHRASSVIERLRRLHESAGGRGFKSRPCRMWSFFHRHSESTEYTVLYTRRCWAKIKSVVSRYVWYHHQLDLSCFFWVRINLSKNLYLSLEIAINIFHPEGNIIPFCSFVIQFNSIQLFHQLVDYCWQWFIKMLSYDVKVTWYKAYGSISLHRK